MTRRDTPESDWTDAYGWGRLGNSYPYPCPADWVIESVEMEYVRWQRYPGIGEGITTDEEIWDIFDGDYADRHHAQEEIAELKQRPQTSRGAHEDETLHIFTVDEETIFRRKDPDEDDLFRSVAEGLVRYSNGQSLFPVSPQTGLPVVIE